MNQRIIPDVAGTVRGYRVWYLTGGLNLMSTGQNHYWFSGREETARCMSGGYLHGGGIAPKIIPSMRCMCGLYSVTHPDHLPLAIGTSFPVVGVVESWGSIIEHERNGVMRAEYARIVALACLDRYHYGSGRPLRRTAQHLASKYGVPFYKNQQALLDAYPAGEDTVNDERRRWARWPVRPR